MRPVLLSVVEGKKFLIGTFDTTNLHDWWKSESFPGDIDCIENPIHVYGQYHVCIVKKTDGTYSIYRSKNAGKSWIEVYNTPSIIYSLTTIDYGWIIGSTSTGWIESKLDSGYTWTSLSSFAPGCKTVINIDDDVLFAHDGRKIWKSTDFGRTWSAVLNKDSWYSKPLHDGWDSHTFAWTGTVEPALAGINQTVLVGFGPYLVISEDIGNSWVTHYSGWEGISCGPGVGVWHNSDNGTGPLGGTFAPYAGTRILQILLTDGNGKTPNETAFIIKSKVNSTIYYMYSGPRYVFYSGQGTNVGTGWSWISTYSMPYRPQPMNMAAYNVLRPGSSEYDIFATITSYDSNNNPVILTSTNGGYTWSSLNYSNVTVYDGDPEQEILSDNGQQVFDEEYWTSYAWVGSACHNTGRYVIDYNKTIRGISWDMDVLTGFTKTKSYTSDMVTYITRSKTCNFDIINKIIFTEYITPDILLKDTINVSHYPSMRLKKDFPSSHDMDIINAFRKISELDMDLLILKTCPIEMYPRMYLIGPREKTYGMEMKLVDNHVDEIMNSIEKYTIQLPDIKYPDIPYKPVDFRTDEVTL